MKPNRLNPLFARFFGASLTTFIVISGSAAADVIKANNSDALNLSSSWGVGGPPTSSDIAVWDSTVTTSNSPLLGAATSWAGIKISNPGGLVSIDGTGSASNTITVGASGINMGAATADLVVNSTTANFNTSQTWNVNTGRNLRFGTTGTGATNAKIAGSSNAAVISISGGGLVDVNQGASPNGAGGYLGKWLVNSGATLRGLRSTTEAWGSNTAADAITLSGGILAVGGISGTSGDWTWNQPITLTAATNSKLSAQNFDAVAHTLTLTGAVTGSGNLTLEKTQSGAGVFVFNNLGTTAGVHTNVMGTGNITVNGVTLQPRAGGTGNVITHNNNIKLIGGTLISDDSLQTYAGNFTIEGSNSIQARWGDKAVTIGGNIVDGSVSGSLNFTNSVYLNGTNTYTGATSATGNVYVTSGQGLGTGQFTNDGGQIFFQPATAGITSTVSSLRSRGDVHLNNNVLLNITSGNLGMRVTNGFWIKNSAGASGRLTSSSGALNISSMDASWVTSTGAFTTADHRIYIPIVDFNGSTPLAITKNGVNQLTLGSTNTYTGGTTVNGGRLQIDNASGLGIGGAVSVASGAQVWLNSGAAIFSNNFTVVGVGPTDGVVNDGAIRFNNNTISGSVTIGAGGARIGGNGSSGTISGALGGGNVPLDIFNANITLSGNATAYTGTTTITQGSLKISSGTTFNGTVSKSPGTTLTNNGAIALNLTHINGVLKGTGTFLGNLTLNAATSADVLDVIPGAMHVNGNLTLSGNTTVRASGLGGAVTVLTYDGVLTGDATNLSLEDAGSFRGSTTFDTSTPGVITLTIDGADIVWSGAINHDWDVTTLNWKKGIVDDKYFQSDNVTFGDTGAGAIAIVGTITPGSITIHNSSGNDYTFTGGGANVIGGTTGLTKTGGGALTLASSNTFTGAVSLDGGYTTFSASQAYTGGTTINNDAILDLTGGGGGTGAIRGTLNVNDTGMLRMSTGDAIGYNAGGVSVSVINLNGGTIEVNNPAANETFQNLALTMSGGHITRGFGANNGNIDISGGSTSFTTLSSVDTSLIEYGVNIGLKQPSTTFTVASGATSGVDLQIDGSFNNSIYSYANPNVVKNGPGTMLLNNPPTTVGGAAVYTGTTTINAGTLQIGNGGDAGIIGTGNIIDNSILIFNRYDTVTVPNTITGTGTIVQNGDGALILASGGARSGDTEVNAGKLYVGTTPFTASTFRANTGGSISAGTPSAIGTGTLSNLDLNGGGAAYRVSTASSDKLLVTAPDGFRVSASSPITITPTGSVQTGDIIPLIDYSGTVGGIGLGVGNANVPVVSAGNPHLQFSLVNNVVNTTLDLSVDLADTIVWLGNTDNVWDEQNTSNWQTVSDSQTSKFYLFDKVKFTDAGSANTTVDLTADMAPSYVEFDATINYVLTNGGITGDAQLIKKNTGTTTLSNYNTYTGTTTIQGGTLQIGDTGILPVTPITNDATLAYNITTPRTITHSISGTGQLVKRGSGNLTVSGASGFTGPVVVEAGTLSMPAANTVPTIFGTTDNGIVVNAGATFNSNGNNTPLGEAISIIGTGVAGYAYTGDGTLQGNLTLTGNATVGSNTANAMNLGTGGAPITITGAFTLTKAGTNRLWYRAPADGVGNTLAAVVVNGGTFGIEAGNNGLNGVPITVNATGILSSWAAAGASTQNNPITLNGGNLSSDFGGDIWSGPVNLTANSTLGSPNSTQNFTISGAISETAGSFGLTKTQIGVVTLTSVNTYTGSTTVNEGGFTLAATGGLKFVIGANGVNNKVTGAGTATIDGSFTLDLSGAAIANGNSWTLVDTTTKSFGATFAIAGFTEVADVHTKTVGSQTWTFSEATGILSLAIAGGYDSWLANYPGLPLDQRGATADYDGDGLNNLLEYTLGGSPLVSDAASIAPVGANDGLGNFVVTFKRGDLSETDTTQVLQYGTTLADWTDIPIGASPGAGMVSIIENGAADDSVTVTIPTAGATRFFVHLKVTKP